MNVINLIGRLTRDPELRYGQKGTAVANFTLAVNRDRNREETDFIDCVAFDRQAEIVASHMTKGKQIGVTGTLQIGTYQRRDGSTAKAAKVVVNHFDFLTPKAANHPAERPTGDWDSLGSEINVNGSTGNFEPPAPETDDLPF